MRKKKIGYTTGVYDLFHVGHLRLLQRAKSHCDYLIVGVSTDDLVESYKNKRPIIPYEDRFEIVSALRCVDKVVPQEHRDKIKAFHDIGFDVMFVGNDWKGSKLFNSVEVELKKHGASLIYFEYTKNISSTSLKSTLQSIYDDENLIQ